MKVSAITPNYSVNYNKSSNYATNSVSSNKVYKQNNELMDMNYGASLVSFKGLNNKVAYDLSDKVSGAYASLVNKNDILLVGKDIASAKKALVESAKDFKYLLKNVLVVTSPTIAGTVAIRRNDDGFDELYNLSNSPLFVKRNEKNPLGLPPSPDQKNESSDFFFIKKGDAPTVLLDFDSVSYSSSKTDFVIDKNMENPFEVSAAGEISEFVMPSVADINKKNAEGILVESELSPEKAIKLADVGGQDEAIAQLKQKVLFPIKYPNFFEDNMKGLNSALLVGPPGTGKTLAAMALANEAGVPFYNMNGQLLEGKYVGESAHNIDAYYEQVKQNQPCILFFDEADAIFGKRTGEHKYADDSVNMHLDKISELEKQGAKVFLLAATNHPDLMDEGVLRNGRFGTKIEFKAPDTEEKCIDIFNIHSNGSSLENVDKEQLAKRMLDAKFNGADIAALVNEAKMQSVARQGIFEQMDKGTYDDKSGFRLVLNNDDFNNALDKLIANKNVIIGYDETRHRVAGFRAEQ